MIRIGKSVVALQDAGGIGRERPTFLAHRVAPSPKLASRLPEKFLSCVTFSCLITPQLRGSCRLLRPGYHTDQHSRAS
jgi:hypothetical protein